MVELRRNPVDPMWLRKLFASLGPIHRIGILSGWFVEFLELTARFDEALFDYLESRALASPKTANCAARRQ